jgi:hypothetical protein
MPVIDEEYVRKEQINRDAEICRENAKWNEEKRPEFAKGCMSCSRIIEHKGYQST